jgi:hypothetical protein
MMNTITIGNAEMFSMVIQMVVTCEGMNAVFIVLNVKCIADDYLRGHELQYK